LIRRYNTSAMPSFSVVTLGCKVNHYESLQVEQLLRSMGYSRATPDVADVIILNTCSVTSAAGAKSRNLLRRYSRPRSPGHTPLTIAIGCWAGSDTAAAQSIVGPSAVFTHKDDLHTQLLKLLTPDRATGSTEFLPYLPAEPSTGALSLPLLHSRQPDTQRAILKVQDGCDAHCTYCIIPKLRPLLWHKPVHQALQEASALVAAGHHEIVLTGVFLGAYGYNTALRHRQFNTPESLPTLIDALCTQVPGLQRLRLSSLEPGDITPELLRALAAHRQVMPHFHLPLQSGSDTILSKMNRQYTRADYLQSVGRLRDLFDRPALTTDIIVGFPGETDDFFAQTLDLVQQVGFLHTHCFPFSPRQGTAAARWKSQFVHHQTITDRMDALEKFSLQQSLTYRQQFVGQTAEILVEHPGADESASSISPSPTPPLSHSSSPAIRHGRCERYFSIHFEAPPGSPDLTGQLILLKITQATPHRTLGTPQQ